MDTINYIGNNSHLEEKLGQFFRSKNYHFEHYPIKTTPNVPYLIILEPYKLGQNYFHIHTIWRSFFECNQKYTELKLMVAGFDENEGHPNYINLFNLGSNNEGLLINAKTIADGWEMPLDYKDIRERLSKFFKGHNKVSLFQKLNYLQFSVNNIHFAITGKINRTYEDAERRILPMAQRQWKDFQDRWRNYHRFFNCCPFFIEQEAIAKTLEEIRPYFEEPKPDAVLFQDLKCYENIQLIRKNLTKMDKYVRPEIYRKNITD